MKPKVEKFKRISICLKETDCFHKIWEDKQYLKEILILLSLRSISQAKKWLKNTDNKCFKK